MYRIQFVRSHQIGKPVSLTNKLRKYFVASHYCSGFDDFYDALDRIQSLPVSGSFFVDHHFKKMYAARHACRRHSGAVRAPTECKQCDATECDVIFSKNKHSNKYCPACKNVRQTVIYQLGTKENPLKKAPIARMRHEQLVGALRSSNKQNQEQSKIIAVHERQRSSNMNPSSITRSIRTTTAVEGDFVGIGQLGHLVCLFSEEGGSDNGGKSLVSKMIRNDFSNSDVLRSMFCHFLSANPCFRHTLDVCGWVFV